MILTITQTRTPGLPPAAMNDREQGAPFASIDLKRTNVTLMYDNFQQGNNTLALPGWRGSVARSMGRTGGPLR